MKAWFKLCHSNENWLGLTTTKTAWFSQIDDHPAKNHHQHSYTNPRHRSLNTPNFKNACHQKTSHDNWINMFRWAFAFNFINPTEGGATRHNAKEHSEERTSTELKQQQQEASHFAKGNLMSYPNTQSGLTLTSFQHYKNNCNTIPTMSYPKLGLASCQPHFNTMKNNGNTMPTPFKTTIPIQPFGWNRREELHPAHASLQRRPAQSTPGPTRITSQLWVRIHTYLDP
jgi:hypothetical protein